MVTSLNSDARPVPPSTANGLRSWLGELDALLSAACSAARSAFGATAVLDPYRGLHISEDDVARLLARRPTASSYETSAEDGFDPAPPRPVRSCPELERLERVFGLTAFDSGVVLLALAPELDLRYERLYGYLQDDVTMRRPTVDLALNLLCANAAARVAARQRFGEAAPLRRHRLLHLIPVRDRAPLLAHVLKLDEQVVRLFTADEGLDPRLAQFAALSSWVNDGDDRSATQTTVRTLAALIDRSRDGYEPWIELYGPVPSEQACLVRCVAQALRRPLLAADPARVGLTGTSLREAFSWLVREAWLHGAVLQLRAFGPDAAEHRALLDEALAAFPTERPVCIVSTDQRAPTAALTRHQLPSVIVALPFPDAGERKAIWSACLADGGVPAEDIDLDVIAGRYRMSREQIAAAVSVARGQSAWRSANRKPADRKPADLMSLSTDDLSAAARAEIRIDLGGLATKVESTRDWSDLVLPDDVFRQLQELSTRVAYRDRVLVDWGFQDRLGQAAGAPALFAGPSGTGKTMAAALIARELALDCFKIELAGVVSKYIGETEKNLDRIFVTAENASVLLFFDECDALFGKRSEVRDAHDRYANIETAFLLQRIETYPGPVILATNLRHNLDEAFTRRLAFTIYFPFPEEEERRRIWAQIWPPATTVAADVDPAELARRYPLSGGNIRNAALASAFLAAADGGVVQRHHLLHAVRREYQKLGAVPPEARDA